MNTEKIIKINVNIFLFNTLNTPFLSIKSAFNDIYEGLLAIILQSFYE